MRLERVRRDGRVFRVVRTPDGSREATGASPEPMTVHDSHDRDRARPADPPPKAEAGRTAVVERLRDVSEPSSAVDHLLSHLSGGRTAAEMTVVDWVLPVARTEGSVVLRVGRPAPDDEAAYLGFDDGRYVATPWTAHPAFGDGSDEPRPVEPREWFPADARVDVVPVELSPFDE